MIVGSKNWYEYQKNAFFMQTYEGVSLCNISWQTQLLFLNQFPFNSAVQSIPRVPSTKGIAGFFGKVVTQPQYLGSQKIVGMMLLVSPFIFLMGMGFYFANYPGALAGMLVGGQLLHPIKDEVNRDLGVQKVPLHRWMVIQMLGEKLFNHLPILAAEGTTIANLKEDQVLHPIMKGILPRRNTKQIPFIVMKIQERETQDNKVIIIYESVKYLEFWRVKVVGGGPLPKGFDNLIRPREGGFEPFAKLLAGTHSYATIVNE